MLAVVVDHVGLAVHEILGPHDRAAEGLAHRLMAQAHAQAAAACPSSRWQHSTEMPASVGVHGPGEMITRSGLRLEHLVDRDLVVAKDLDVERRIDLAQPLHEVVGERVVVVDDDDHGDRIRDVRSRQSGAIRSLAV